MSTKIDNDVLVMSWDNRFELGLGYHMASDEVRGLALRAKPEEGADNPGIDAAVKTVPYGNQTLPRGEDMPVPDQINELISKSWETAAEQMSQQDNYFGNVYAPHVQVDYSLKFIDSRKDIRDTMDISGAISFSNAQVSASAKGAYSKKDIKSDEKVYYLIAIKVRTFTKRLDREKLLFSPEVQEIIGLDRDKFEDRFGDAFVSGVVYGGEMNALLEIAASSDEDVMDIKASAKIEYGKTPAMKITAEADFSMVVGNLTKGRNVDITTNVTGGTLVRIPSKPEDFLAAANEFIHSLVSPQGNPVPVRVLITPYRHLQQWADGSVSQYIAQSLVKMLVDLFLDFEATGQSILAREKAILTYDDAKLQAKTAVKEGVDVPTIIMRLHYLLDFCVRSQIRIAGAVRKRLGTLKPESVVPRVSLAMFNQVVEYKVEGSLQALSLEGSEEVRLETLLDIVPVPPAYVRLLLEKLCKLPSIKDKA